jgi:hypothetical protein
MDFRSTNPRPRTFPNVAEKPGKGLETVGFDWEENGESPQDVMCERINRRTRPFPTEPRKLFLANDSSRIDRIN